MSAVETDRELLADFRRAVRAKIERDLREEDAVAEELRARVVPRVRAGLGQARREGLCGPAWLFGSYAWGRPTRRSDVDLLIEGARDAMMVAAVVGAACGLEVHAVRRERAPGSLTERVLAEGVPL